jgi:hypothetical protein
MRDVLVYQYLLTLSPPRKGPSTIPKSGQDSRNDSSLVFPGLEMRIWEEEKHLCQLYIPSAYVPPPSLTRTYLALCEKVWHVFHRVCSNDGYILIPSLDDTFRLVIGNKMRLGLTSSEDSVIDIGSYRCSDLHPWYQSDLVD